MRLEEFFIAAELLVIGVGVYGAIGIVAAVALALRALPRMDPAIAASPGSVRLLLLPGLVALWPVMLAKWARSSRGVGAPHSGIASGRVPGSGD